jgi:hypothetical protein
MTARLVCEGAQVGSLHVPPFELRPGTSICLHLPSPVRYGDMERLAWAFTGRDGVRGIHVQARMLSALSDVDLPHPRGLLGLFYRPRVKTWLLRRSRRSAEEVNRILHRHGWTDKTQIVRLAGTPKTLLALEAAWAAGAEGILFTTMGLDPLGEERVKELVLQHLEDCPAVHLSTQYTCNGQVGRRCFTPGICIETLEATSLATPSGRL